MERKIDDQNELDESGKLTMPLWKYIAIGVGILIFLSILMYCAAHCK